LSTASVVSNDAHVTIIGGYVGAIIRALEARGIATDAVLRAAGVSQAPSNDPLNRIPLTSLQRLAAAAFELTNDPYFGLYAANFLHAANLHALGFAMTASETLRELCKRMSRYFRLLSGASRPELNIRDGEARLEFVFVAASPALSEDVFGLFLVRLFSELSDGKVRTIGVSNFMPEHLTQLLAEISVVPAVNQIEVHPYFRQSELLAAHTELGILSQAWSPIGGITFYRNGSHGSTLEDAVIGGIASSHGKTPAQVMLRWHLQQGRQVIPKSVNPKRIKENLDVFDFDLTADELAAIDTLDTGVRGGPEPAAVTRETFGLEIPEA